MKSGSATILYADRVDLLSKGPNETISLVHPDSSGRGLVLAKDQPPLTRAECHCCRAPIVRLRAKDTGGTRCYRCGYVVCRECLGHGTAGPHVCGACVGGFSLRRLFGATAYGVTLLVEVASYCDRRGERLLRCFFPALALEMERRTVAPLRGPINTPRSTRRQLANGNGAAAQAELTPIRRGEMEEAPGRNGPSTRPQVTPPGLCRTSLPLTSGPSSAYRGGGPAGTVGDAERLAVSPKRVPLFHQASSLLVKQGAGSKCSLSRTTADSRGRTRSASGNGRMGARALPVSSRHSSAKKSSHILESTASPGAHRVLHTENMMPEKGPFVKAAPLPARRLSCPGLGGSTRGRRATPPTAAMPSTPGRLVLARGRKGASLSPGRRVGGKSRVSPRKTRAAISPRHSQGSPRGEAPVRVVVQRDEIDPVLPMARFESSLWGASTPSRGVAVRSSVRRPMSAQGRAVRRSGRQPPANAEALGSEHMAQFLETFASTTGRGRPRTADRVERPARAATSTRLGRSHREINTTLQQCRSRSGGASAAATKRALHVEDIDFVSPPLVRETQRRVMYQPKGVVPRRKQGTARAAKAGRPAARPVTVIINGRERELSPMRNTLTPLDSDRSHMSDSPAPRFPSFSEFLDSAEPHRHSLYIEPNIRKDLIAAPAEKPPPQIQVLERSRNQFPLQLLEFDVAGSVRLPSPFALAENEATTVPRHPEDALWGDNVDTGDSVGEPGENTYFRQPQWQWSPDPAPAAPAGPAAPPSEVVHLINHHQPPSAPLASSEDHLHITSTAPSVAGDASGASPSESTGPLAQQAVTDADGAGSSVLLAPTTVAPLKSLAVRGCTPYVPSGRTGAAHGNIRQSGSTSTATLPVARPESVRLTSRQSANKSTVTPRNVRVPRGSGALTTPRRRVPATRIVQGSQYLAADMSAPIPAPAGAATKQRARTATKSCCSKPSVAEEGSGAANRGFHDSRLAASSSARRRVGNKKLQQEVKAVSQCATQAPVFHSNMVVHHLLPNSTTTGSRSARRAGAETTVLTNYQREEFVRPSTVAQPVSVRSMATPTRVVSPLNPAALAESARMPRKTKAVGSGRRIVSPHSRALPVQQVSLLGEPQDKTKHASGGPQGTRLYPGSRSHTSAGRRRSMTVGRTTRGTISPLMRVSSATPQPSQGIAALDGRERHLIAAHRLGGAPMTARDLLHPVLRP